MNALVICALVAGAALATQLMILAAGLRTPRWPAREPEYVEDDRSHDHRLAELARQLGSTNLTEAHHTVVALAERLSADGSRLDPRVTAFLDHPPLDRPDRYRRALDAALTRLEQA